jgi:hypothetical protein
MIGRYEGAVEVGSEWQSRSSGSSHVIRLVGPEEALEGGWLYEYVTVAGKPADGRKKKRIPDDVLRSAYEPFNPSTEEE